MLIKTIGELREFIKDLPDDTPVLRQYHNECTPFIYPEVGMVDVFQSKDWGWNYSYDGMDEETKVYRAFAFHLEDD